MMARNSLWREWTTVEHKPGLSLYCQLNFPEGCSSLYRLIAKDEILQNMTLVSGSKYWLSRGIIFLLVSFLVPDS